MKENIIIQDIWLIREGGENDERAEVVVYVKRDGIWYEAIREYVHSSFSHCISAMGLASEMCHPVAWMNEAESRVK